MRRPGALIVATALLLALAAGIVAGVAARVSDGPRLLGTFPVAPGPTDVQIDPRSGRVFVAGVAQLDAFVGETGRSLYQLPLTNAHYLALDPRINRLFVPDSRASLLAADLPSGHLVRYLTVGNAPFAVAVDTRRGHAFVASAGAPSGSFAPCKAAYLSMLDARSAALLRTVSFGLPAVHTNPAQSCLVALSLDPGMAAAVDERHGRLFVLMRVFTPSFGVLSTVNVFETEHGTLLHSVQLANPAHEVAVDERTGRAFVTSFDGVTVLDAASGRPLRTIRLPMAYGLAVDAPAGRIYVDNGQALRVLDARSGTPVRTMRLPVWSGVPLVAVDTRSRRVFALSWDISDMGRNGMVYVIDAHNDRLLDTVTVGGQPAAMAVDERRGRLFVVNQGAPPGSIPSPTASATVSWWRHPLEWLPRARRPAPPDITASSVSVIDANR